MAAVIAAWSLAVQDSWPFLLIPLAVALAILGYRRTTPPLAPRRRLPLVALRALAYIFLLLVLASPILNRDKGESQRARIAVLVDESASMSSLDTPGGPTRLARARAAVRELRDGLRDAAVDVEISPFASEVSPPLPPETYFARPDSASGA